MKRLTHDDVLLAAAHGLERVFTGPQLVVACWSLRPTWFGLRGFEELHPCSNRVYARLDGEKGLARLGGPFVRLGKRRYRLSAHGIEAARLAKLLVDDLNEASA